MRKKEGEPERSKGVAAARVPFVRNPNVLLAQKLFPGQ